MQKIDYMEGMRLWLDATDSNTVFSDFMGNVSKWEDKSGLGFHFHQNKKECQPKTGVRTFNRKNVISFDGDHSTIHGVKNIETQTIFIVALADYGYKELSGLFNEAVKDENNIRLEKDFKFRGNSLTNHADFTDKGKMYINGAISQEIYPQTPFILTAISHEKKYFTPLLSQSFFDDRYWKGDIGEVIIFDHQLSEDKLDIVGKYLVDKWDI